jgi:hypothetical protein
VAVTSVHIRGDGIAAWCCARLLSNAGVSVSIEKPPARPRPWILISEPSERLLCELATDADLFRDVPRIRKRTVAWGAADAVTMTHSAAIVAEQDLLSRLWPKIPEGGSGGAWSILAAPPVPAEQHCFGARMAWIAEVVLTNLTNDAREACWIESLEQGWLFLIAGTGSQGSLIAVGAEPAELLKTSRCVAPLIASVGAMQTAPAYPRIAAPMFGEDWLACGTAAMALDPLCGDGCGHAIREAILASAVLRGGACQEMLQHYEARLHIAFERHLALCRNFYVTGRAGGWWDGELELLDRGIDWMRARSVTTWRYRLEGFDLIPL